MALALAHITFVFQFHRHRKISAVKNTSTHPHTYASAIAMQCGHQKCQSILLFNALPAILSFSFFRSYAGWLTIHSTHLFPLSFSLILVVFFLSRSGILAMAVCVRFKSLVVHIDERRRVHTTIFPLCRT